MTAETQCGIPAGLDGEATLHPYRGMGFRALWIATVAALAIILILFTLGRFGLRDVGREALGDFIYCVFVAVPSVYALTWVSHRYGERYPRLIIPVRALMQFAIAVIACLAAGVVLQWIGNVAQGAYWSQFWRSAPFSVVIALMFGLSITSFETMRFKLQAATLELRTRQVEQERAYKLLAESRLMSLESRIHPHFLFNTLNSIAALIPSDPARAEQTVGRLASLLRFSLNAHGNGALAGGLVPLSMELKIVRDYLEIEATRFGPRIRYEIAVPDALGAVRVPPLALQSLVENSVKHVAAQRQQGAMIVVSGSRDAARVRLSVADDGPGFTIDAIRPEHGLGNLAGRMELLYAGAGKLDVVREGDRTAVHLSFPA